MKTSFCYIEISSDKIYGPHQGTSDAWPRGYKTFFMLNSTKQEIFLLINVKMPTIVGILTNMSRKNSILYLAEPKKSRISWYFYTYEHLKFHTQLSWAQKSFITSRPGYVEVIPVCPHFFLTYCQVKFTLVEMNTCTYICITYFDFNTGCCRSTLVNFSIFSGNKLEIKSLKQKTM